MRNLGIFLFTAFWLWAIWWAGRFTLFAYDYTRVLLAQEGYSRSEFEVREAGWTTVGTGRHGGGIKVFELLGTVAGHEERMRVQESEIELIRIVNQTEHGNRYAKGAVLEVWYNPGVSNGVNAAETVRIAPYGPEFFARTGSKLKMSVVGGYAPLILMLVISYGIRTARSGRHSVP